MIFDGRERADVPQPGLVGEVGGLLVGVPGGLLFGRELTLSGHAPIRPQMAAVQARQCYWLIDS